MIFLIGDIGFYRFALLIEFIINLLHLLLHLSTGDCSFIFQDRFILKIQKTLYIISPILQCQILTPPHAKFGTRKKYIY